MMGRPRKDSNPKVGPSGPPDMDKFQDALKMIKNGERTRVLFDMLMEHISATEDLTKAGFFELIKQSLSNETEGHIALTEMTKSP